jgi:hypothetical protein
MEQYFEKKLPVRFAEGFTDIPPLPGHLYGSIIRKIERKKIFTRSMWAAAATIVIAVISLTAFRLNTPSVAYSPEVADELVTINSYYNGGSTDEDDDANFENIIYIP